MKKNKV